MLNLRHPLHSASAALSNLPVGHPAYVTLQSEGSAWSRYTPYGDRAVEYALRAIACFQEHLPHDARILCAGCNDGLEMEVFLKVGYPVDGFDLDHEKVRVAVYNGLQAKVGDIHDPPFSSNTYEGIFCSHTLEHSLDKEKALLALINLLKSGGLLWLAYPIEESFPMNNPSHTGHVSGTDVVEKILNPVATLLSSQILKNPEPQAIQVWKKI